MTDQLFDRGMSRGTRQRNLHPNAIELAVRSDRKRRFFCRMVKNSRTPFLVARCDIRSRNADWRSWIPRFRSQSFELFVAR